MGDIRLCLQYLFQTNSKTVLAVSASGNGGMESLITNLLGPGETLLVAMRGIWDERAANMAKRHGMVPLYLKYMDGFALLNYNIYVISNVHI